MTPLNKLKTTLHFDINSWYHKTHFSENWCILGMLWNKDARSICGTFIGRWHFSPWSRTKYNVSLIHARHLSRSKKSLGWRVWRHLRVRHLRIDMRTSSSPLTRLILMLHLLDSTLFFLSSLSARDSVRIPFPETWFQSADCRRNKNLIRRND